MPIMSRKYIFKWSIFHCHVNGNLQEAAHVVPLEGAPPGMGLLISRKNQGRKGQQQQQQQQQQQVIASNNL